ncbi:MAG: OmpA family protein, partial [Oceanidesulfovibrio sp.]
NRVAVYVEEVLSKPMEDKMVVIQAEELASDLDTKGKVAIYGILFDYDKADIKPDSRAQLEQMAAMLSSRPELNVLIVGHTDNQGGLDYNMSLSQRRAEAVASALSGEFGIDASRLTPKGVAYLAPVTTNRTEDGRAKNRRVEMVEH